MTLLYRASVLCSVLLLLSACASAYRLQDVAKSDASLVYDLNYRQAMTLLRELTVKLYKRNPKQLPKNATVHQRIESLFEVPDYLEFRECGGAIETELMEQVLAADFKGDRVFCLMAGLLGMIKHSYSYRSDFYMTHSLDEQKLYKSARNIERLAWRLRKIHATAEHPPLLTNSLEPDAINLSYERLFGKLIGQQDMLALIVAGKNKRAINYVVRQIGSFFFLPL